jgi:hypothetical protein
MKIRKKMIEAAKPENSLQIRRDLRFRDIHGFDPNQMGIFLNERISGSFQITVVPLANGNLAFRYVKQDAEAQLITSTVVGRDASTANRTATILKDNTTSRGIFGKKERIKNPEKLIEDAWMAQEKIGKPQEMELRLDANGEHFFVQTRSVNPETTEDDPEVETNFNNGVQNSFIEESRSFTPTPLLYELASERDQRRDTTLLVADELSWCVEERLFESAYANHPDWYQYLTSQLDLLNDFEPRKVLTPYQESLKKREDKLRAMLKRRYEELGRIAEEASAYTIWLKSTPFLGKQCREIPVTEEIERLRKQIIDCASVVIRGYSNYYTGALGYSHHFQFGSSGPQQIGVYYSSGGMTLPNWVHNRRNEGKNALLNEVKTGDGMEVLFKRGRGISLIPKEISANK